MITEDALRSLMTDDDPPPSLSPAQVRARARVIRRNRRAAVVAGVALVLPSLVIGLSRVALFQRASPGSGLPVAFGGDGEPVPLLAQGRVALAFPGQTAWATPDEECVSDVPNSDIGGWCRVDSPEETDGFSMGGGALFGVVAEPVVRADFYDGSSVVHAQVVGFAAHPRWRTVSAVASWPAKDDETNKIYLRGWDAAGKLILSVGCPGGCPVVPQQAPDPANEAPPAAKSAVPMGGPLAVLPDMRVAVLPGADAWPTSHGVCVGNDNSSQCVTDGDAQIDDGFAFGGGVASTVLGKPVTRAEFTVDGVVVPAGVVEFASHPQWRVVVADLKVPTWAGTHIALKGWDSNGKLIVSFEPDQSERSMPPSTGTTTPVR